jgi:hypothetical protein
MPLISGCFGEYTTVDKVCNGDKESLDAEDRQPCEWRARCKAFKKYMAESGRPLNAFLKKVEEDGEPMYEAIHGFPQFASFCDRLVERYKKAKSQQVAVDRRRYGPSPRTMQAAAASLTKRAKERRKLLADWITVFVDDFSNQLKNKRFATAGVAIPVGQFYLIDRLDSSDYMSICYRTETGHDSVLARVYRKTMKMNYDVWTSLTVEELSGVLNKRDFRRWQPEVKLTGKINSKIKDLSKADLSMLGESLARAVNRGKFPAEEGNKQCKKRK